MHTANLSSRRPTTVLGTVMGVVRQGGWVIHQVTVTRPDGHRMTLEVVSKQRHSGSVSVRWDPRGIVEPHFVTTRVWGLYAVAALLVIAVAVIAWFVIS